MYIWPGAGLFRIDAGQLKSGIWSCKLNIDLSSDLISWKKGRTNLNSRFNVGFNIDVDVGFNVGFIPPEGPSAYTPAHTRPGPFVLGVRVHVHVGVRVRCLCSQSPKCLLAIANLAEGREY